MIFAFLLGFCVKEIVLREPNWRRLLLSRRLREQGILVCYHVFC
jgi:hypothetical protein